MRERGYLWLLSSASLIGWATFFLVIINVNPFEAGWEEFLFFYVSLAIALVGTFFLLGWGLRKRLGHRFRLHNSASVMWRQTLLITSLIILLLLLQSVRLLSWWNILLLVSAVGILEYFFIIYSKEQK